ncbi:MAG: Uncharacterised protein [Acidimicrobiales bacterium AG-410-I20]|nr:MAG: Uncharacterised protein [Acidimicrobiales bacterium AG-410-I20]
MESRLWTRNSYTPKHRIFISIRSLFLVRAVLRIRRLGHSTPLVWINFGDSWLRCSLFIETTSSRTSKPFNRSPFLHVEPICARAYNWTIRSFTSIRYFPLVSFINGGGSNKTRMAMAGSLRLTGNSCRVYKR